MSGQLATFTGQATGLHAGGLCRIQLLHHIGQKQDAVCRNANGCRDGTVGLFLTLVANGSVKITAEQWRQIACLAAAKNQLLRRD